MLNCIIELGGASLKELRMNVTCGSNLSNSFSHMGVRIHFFPGGRVKLSCRVRGLRVKLYCRVRWSEYN